MLIFIIATFKFGIGVGLYPIEAFSFKYYLSNKNFLQMTFGVYLYADTILEEQRFACIISIRGAHQLSHTSTDYYNYSQLIGVGIRLHFKKETFPLQGEFFYEFDLLPNPKDVPISIAPNLIGVISKEKKISPAIGGGGHYYLR